MRILVLNLFVLFFISNLALGVTADYKGKTPLMIAAEKGHAQAVGLLLDKGANINEIDQHKRTPLHFAVWKEHKEVVRILLQYGANPNTKDVLGFTPLQMALFTRNAEVINLF